MTDAPAPGTETALFVGDRELHRRLAPHMGRDAFKAAVKAAELQGFPGVSVLWRGRYWPAVVAWLDRENGVEGNAPDTAGTQDGPENFDNAPARQNPRVEDRPQRSPVLDRAAGRARPDGVSRSLHPIAGGRR